MDGLKWSKLNKNGTVGNKAYFAPPPDGVGIAQCNVPFFPDNQYTLNYTSMDGVVVGVRLCCNGQQRDAALRDAIRYL